jgi:monoamine oxidase
VQFFLSHPVTKIEWQKNNVEAIANNKTFIAQKILITVPVGVLQSGAISFSPALSKQMLAAKQLGFGAVIKTILQFEEAFWKNKELTQQKDLSEMSFAFSQEVIPTWWTYFPKNVAMLTGWSGGPHAEILKDLHDEDILQKALDSLAQLFEVDISYLRQNLKGWHVANWVKDPYSCGGYSYEVVNGETAKKILKEPVEETIFFAGEGLFEGTEIGTVNAALVVGRDTAHQMIGLF